MVDSERTCVMIEDGGLPMKERQTFSRSFKLAAVKKVVEQGRKPSDVAKELGIQRELIYNWKAKFEQEGLLKAPAGETLEEENARLRERVRQLEMERDILKKAEASSRTKSRKI